MQIVQDQREWRTNEKTAVGDYMLKKKKNLKIPHALTSALLRGVADIMSALENAVYTFRK